MKVVARGDKLTENNHQALSFAVRFSISQLRVLVFQSTPAGEQGGAFSSYSARGFPEELVETKTELKREQAHL